jgi:peptidyl-prolyl cis-trans isomerase C
MIRLVAQPLVQFLLIGALIFGFYKLVARPENPPNSIQVGATELGWLRNVWQGQFGRPPSAEELRAAVKVHVDEEMRYREAQALGLDRDDTIVRRRMAQKFDFLMGSQANDSTPTEVELRALFNNTTGNYNAPSVFEFCQVYFGEGAFGLTAAKTAVVNLSPAAIRDPASIPVGSIQIPFSRCYNDAARADVLRDFGTAFADVLGKLPMGAWQGPVESGYGFHAVFLTTSTPGRQLSFAEARRAVEADWRAQATKAARERQDRELRSRYKITIDEKALRALSGGDAQ